MPGPSGEGPHARPRQRFSVRLQRVWRRYWWLVLGLVLLGSVIVAAWETEGGFFTRVERALHLLPIANRNDTEGLPRSVKIAYFAAAAVILYATYRAVFALLGERLQETRARVTRNHTVVAGLGGYGQELVDALLGTTKVVAVETDWANPAVGRVRDAGGVVVIGDLADPEIARKANVARARRVVAVSGQDASNARIGASMLALGAGNVRRRPLELFVHISDPRLYSFLLHHSFSSEDARLELFNIYERGARGLLVEARGLCERIDSVLVVGAGQLGLALVSQLARDRYEDAPGESAPDKLRVHLVDRAAQERVQLLGDRYCRLLDVCDLVPHELDIESPAFDRLLGGSSGIERIDIAFVCFDDDSRTIASTLNLIDQAHGAFTVVARVTDRSEGIAGMLESTGSRYSEAAAFRPLSMVRRAARADVVLEGIRGQLARQIHDVYRAGHPGGPFDVPWDELSDDGRERNIRHAESIGRQLESAGYRLGPLIDWGAPLPDLTEADVESMSRLEHERWREERVRDGWGHGPARDDDARLHPDLVEWESLPEERREINRRLVRARPEMLAQVGLQVYRV